MNDLTTFMPAVFVILIGQTINTAAHTTHKKHDRHTLHSKEATLHHVKSKHATSHHHGNEKSTRQHGKIAGKRSEHPSKETTMNRVQFKKMQRLRNKMLNITTTDFPSRYFNTNETVSLDSYSFEPMSWSDNRLPPTLRPFDEHVKQWHEMMNEMTYPDTSDPEVTLDPNLSSHQCRVYECGFCLAQFDEDRKLDHHYRSKHRDQWIVTTESPPPPAQCGFCLDYFNRSEFRAHQEREHNVTSQKYPWDEDKHELTYASFDTKEAETMFDERFQGDYNYHTWPKNNTFWMTMYDINSNESGLITHHYVDPWPNEANYK